MRRSPKIDAAKTRAVVGVIRRIAGRITWRRVELEVADFLGHPYTRQALQAHQEVKDAYLGRKRGAPMDGRRPPSAATRVRLERDRRQRQTNADLQAAVDGLNERICILLENGSRHGILKKMLEADLEHINRARKGSRSKAKGRNGRRRKAD